MLFVETMLVRRRLAGRVRKVARLEREERHRAVVEFEHMRVRRELYEELVKRIENRRMPLAETGVRSLEAFLVQDPPARDYGSNALARNERIAGLLAELDEGAR